MSDDQEIISSGTPHEVHLPEGSKTAVHKSATAMEPQIRNTAVNPDETVELVAVVQGVTHNQAEEARPGHTVVKAEETKMAHAVAVDTETDTAKLVHVDEAAQLPDHMVSGDDAAQAERTVSDHAAHAEHLSHPTALPLDQVLNDLPSLDLPQHDADLVETSAPQPAAEEAGVEPEPVAQETVTEADTSVEEVEVAAPAEFMAEMNFPARVVKLKIANDQIRGQIEKLEKPLFAPIPVAAPAPAKGKEKEAAKKPAKGH